MLKPMSSQQFLRLQNLFLRLAYNSRMNIPNLSNQFFYEMVCQKCRETVLPTELDNLERWIYIYGRATMVDFYNW